MAVLYVILRQLAAVDYDLLADAVLDIGFLQQGVARGLF